MAVFTVHAAKTNLSRLIADAEAGGEVIIARGSTPAVRLVPCEGVSAPGDLPPRRPGRLKGIIHLNDSFWDELSDEEMGYGPDSKL